MNKKLNILLLAPSPKLQGGIAKWTKHILNYYRENVLDYNLILLDVSKTKYILEQNIIFGIYLGFVNYLKVIVKLKKVIKNKQIDVVHITSSGSFSLLKDLFLIHLLKRKNIKTVIHFRFGRIPELFIQKNIEWRFLKRVVEKSDTVITIDINSYKTLIECGFANIFNLPNPISNEILDSVKENNNTQIIPRNIVFVGQMVRMKGIYELVEVCSKIENIRLSMYGMLPKKVDEKLYKIGGEGSEEWLHIGGETDYSLIVQKMLEAEIFVLPTYSEGFPNVILESMACGCAIIASAVGAIPEMLDIESETPCGICVEPKNKEQLKKYIEYILENPEIGKEMGKRAKKRVVQEYSIDSVLCKLLDIWKK